MSELYKRIEKLCRENGMRISEMCDACGINPSRISELKSGKYKSLNQKNIQKIADYFGVTSDYLASGEPDGIVRIDTSRDVINPGPLVRSLDDAQLLLLLSACTDEMKRRASKGVGEHGQQD